MKTQLAELQKNVRGGVQPTVDRVRQQVQPTVNRVKQQVQTRSILALTISAERLDVARVRGPVTGELVAKRFDPVKIGADEVLRNPEKAGAALAAALEAAGLREKRCAVAVPPAWALTASTELPAVDSSDLRGYLELRAEREFSIPTSELRLGFSAYTLPDGTQRATLAALPAKRLEAVEAMLAAAGRRATSVTLDLDDCFHAERATGGTTNLHFLADGGYADVVVLTGGGVAALRTLPGPSGKPAMPTEDAANGAAATPGTLGALGASAADDAFNPAAFCREVRITLGRLPTVIQERVRAADFGGEPAAARELCETTREGLRRMGIDSPADCASMRERPAPPRSATRHLRRQTVPFEFVVPKPQRWEVWLQRVNTRQGRRIAAALAAVVLLPLLGFFIRSEQESRLEKRWANMNASVNELDALQQKIRKFRPWFDRKPTGVQLLESLFNAFPDGGDVWAKSIQINGAKVTCTGFARNQPAFLAMLDRLRHRPDVSNLQTQQIRNENPVQFTVVYHWGAEPK